MTLTEWVIIYTVNCLSWWWVIRWTQVAVRKECESTLIESIERAGWDIASIKRLGIVIWGATTIWFLMGFFQPELRSPASPQIINAFL